MVDIKDLNEEELAEIACGKKSRPSGNGFQKGDWIQRSHPGEHYEETFYIDEVQENTYHLIRYTVIGASVLYEPPRVKKEDIGLCPKWNYNLFYKKVDRPFWIKD